ncbi:DUF4149 domain-containing protein [Thiomicrospira sp. WB1]|uniref:DUF4149 domain-containing protein n=1 Tax=Thiomicrospira sp. WB1 TaxID=1685380 RepID=UPI00074719E4|nr:DUF4149 domain-containing protein [Thiomicrospira sp. WB1]KUJ72932.1 hypothetical protein AVO41_03915 [Thiomicrospira sp. WB1]
MTGSVTHSTASPSAALIWGQWLVSAYVVWHWALGYVTGGVLFGLLPSGVAGQLMAHLLQAAYFGAFVGLIALWALGWRAREIRRHRSPFWLLVAFVALTLNAMWVSPLMTTLKQPETMLYWGMNFSFWHGVSQFLYLVSWGAVAWWGLSLMRLSRQSRPTTTSV